MKKKVLYGSILLLITFGLSGCFDNDETFEIDDQTVWHFTIPEDYIKKANFTLNKTQKEDSINLRELGYVNTSNPSFDILYCYKGDFNSLQVSLQDYNPAEEAFSYPQLMKDYNKHYYDMFKNNFGDRSAIDSLTYVEEIDELVFDVIQIAIVFEGVSYVTQSYSHFFNNRIMAIKVSFIDDMEGQRMLKALGESKFKSK